MITFARKYSNQNVERLKNNILILHSRCARYLWLVFLLQNAYIYYTDIAREHGNTNVLSQRQDPSHPQLTGETRVYLVGRSRAAIVHGERVLLYIAGLYFRCHPATRGTACGGASVSTGGLGKVNCLSYSKHGPCTVWRFGIGTRYAYVARQ